MITPNLDINIKKSYILKGKFNDVFMQHIYNLFIIQ